MEILILDNVQHHEETEQASGFDDDAEPAEFRITRINLQPRRGLGSTGGIPAAPAVALPGEQMRGLQLFGAACVIAANPHAGE